MKIVVLGASGQIGSVIYNGLKGTRLVGTSRAKSDKFLQFDPFSDDWSVLGKPDILINSVGQIDGNAKSSFYHIHVDMTKQILANRQQIGNPRIIQVSALGSSEKHQVEFLRTKGIADALLLQQPNTAVIRPSIVCTPCTILVKKMIMLSNLGRFVFGIVPVPKGFLQTRIQPIMPEDLVALIQQVCLKNHVRIIDAVGPDQIRFLDLVLMLMKTRKQKLQMIESSKAVTDLVIGGFLSRLMPSLISVQQYRLSFQDNIGDVTACEQLLDRPLLSTKEFCYNEFAHRQRRNA